MNDKNDCFNIKHVSSVCEIWFCDEEQSSLTSQNYSNGFTEDAHCIIPFNGCFMHALESK